MTELSGKTRFRASPFTRRLFSLVLAFVLLGSNPAGMVRAAPPASPLHDMIFRYSLTVSRDGDPSKPVCVGSTINFYIKAWISGADSAGGPPERKQADGYGFNILNSIDQSGIMSLESGNPVPMPLAPSPANPTRAAIFSFKAQKAGNLKLTFAADLPPELLNATTARSVNSTQLKNLLHVETSLNVQVIDCKLNVVIIENSEINAGSMGRIVSVGIMNQVGLLPTDSTEKDFKGQGLEQIVVIQIAPGAAISITVGTRQVSIDAQKLEGGYHISWNQSAMTVVGTWSDDQGTVINPVPFPAGPTVKFDIGFDGGSYPFENSGGGYKLTSTTVVTTQK
jgi:hypothetical protein